MNWQYQESLMVSQSTFLYLNDSHDWLIWYTTRFWYLHQFLTQTFMVARPTFGKYLIFPLPSLITYHAAYHLSRSRRPECPGKGARRTWPCIGIFGLTQQCSTLNLNSWNRLIGFGVMLNGIPHLVYCFLILPKEKIPAEEGENKQEFSFQPLRVRTQPQEPKNRYAH